MPPVIPELIKTNISKRNVLNSNGNAKDFNILEPRRESNLYL